MDRRTRIALFALFALAGARSARADSDLFEPRLELGLAGGALLPSSDHELFDATQKDHRAFNGPGLDLAFRLGCYPFAFFGGELEGAIAPMRTVDEQGATIFAMRAHGVLQLPYAVTPFVLAGGGFWGLKSASSAIGNDVDPTFHWGLGIKYSYTKNITLRVDGRHIVSASRGRGNADHFEMLSGISFSFGGAGERIQHRPIDFVRPVPLAIAGPAQEKITEPEVVVQPQASELARRLQEAEETREKIVAAFERVHFSWGLAVLREEDRRALDEAAELLDQYPTLRVEIRGHTDSTGPDRFNMRLSQKRALAVRSYLVRKGIHDERLVTRGFGPYQPLETNRTADGRATNRRTEIVVDDHHVSTLQVTVR